MWAQEGWGFWGGDEGQSCACACSCARTHTLIKESRLAEGLTQTRTLPARSPARPKSGAELAQADS